MAEIEPAHIDGIATSGADLRHAWDALQAGVLGGGDLKVTPGAGLSVDVASGVVFMPSPSAALDVGLYRGFNDAVKNSAAFAAGGIQPNGNANPRLDQIIARIYDANHDGTALKLWRFEVLTGTPTPGALLDNRAGAVGVQAGTTFPLGAVRIADLLVPGANPTSIPAGNIRDRRLWARGVNTRYIRKTADYTTTATSDSGIDDANMSLRCELSGADIEVSLRGFADDTTANLIFVLYPASGGSALVEQYLHTGTPAHGSGQLFSWRGAPADLGLQPGSNVLRPAWRVGGGTGTLYARATLPLRQVIWEIHEDVRQVANNN